MTFEIGFWAVNRLTGNNPKLGYVRIGHYLVWNSLVVKVMSRAAKRFVVEAI